MPQANEVLPSSHDMSNPSTAVETEITALKQSVSRSAITVPWAPGQYAQVIVDQVDERDINTPDEWIPRDPRVIRLTGRHPFNVEPPPEVLYQYGLNTPPAVHYVRNHGKVPRLKWKDHQVEITGMVNHPCALTMKDIMECGEHLTFPVTLVCAGNRRKEQNMTKQTIGFNWGPAGVGTSEWTGVRLRDVLLKAGVMNHAQGAKHVWFEGADKLPNDYYGTSIPLELAMREHGDVILAWKQNGELLTPDHGYPIRVIIPGWIGGRMVKWLTKIHVDSQESQNYYHFFDNRILPSNIDKDLADKEGWWYKPEYLFNELNINSAITYPAHEEVLKISTESKYTLKGYAYSGGGRQVTRVELSYNGGQRWEMAKLNPVPASPAGMYWAWTFWSIDVPHEDIQNAKELLVRAWDISNNTQPDYLSWNVMGMGNNPVFRIKVHKSQDNTVWFEHPTIAGVTVGGWMNRADGTKDIAGSRYGDAPVAPIVPAQAKVETKPQSLPKGNGHALKYFTREEVAKHDQEDDVWIIVKNKVYDCTPFLEDHPGGSDSIMLCAGMDATEDFEAVHSTKAWNMLDDYHVGELLEEGKVAPENDVSNETKSLVALNPKEKIHFTLIEREDLSPDTRRFRFALQSDQHKLGLPLGKHMFVYAKINDKLVCRAYTPTTTDFEKGYFELVIKVYFANIHPAFPEGGLLSQYFESLKIGDSIQVKGPVGEIEYKKAGSFLYKKEPRHASVMSFVCGGTGITPFYQIAKDILRDLSDTTKLNLIYANKTESDILLRKELDEWIESGRVNIWYTLDAPPEGWKYGTGFVSKDMIQEKLPEPADDHYIFFCGPPMMRDRAVIPNLLALGYNTERNFLCF